METFPRTTIELAQFLDLTEKELCQFAFRIEKNVRIEERPKPKGGTRVITKPSKKFKALLRKLDSSLLKKVQPHRLLYHKPDSSYIEMVKLHQNKLCLITADIDDFYPSIKPNKVFTQLLQDGFENSVAKLITRLTTVHHSLPQGFPTSSTIAALILKPVVARLEGLTKETNLTIGIYADNLAISANYEAHKFKKLVERIFSQNGYKLDKFKTMTQKDCQEIMNIVLKNGMSVKGEYRREVRKEIFLLSKNLTKLREIDFIEKRRSIKGKIDSYIEQINAKQAKNLRDYAKEKGVPL